MTDWAIVTTTRPASRETAVSTTVRNDGLDAALAQKIQGSFEAQGLMRHLDAELLALGVGRCEVALPWSDKTSQQHGYFHGGVIGALADIAGGFAGYTMLGLDDGILTVEYKLNILAPGQGERLIGRGKVVRAGRTLTVTTADIVAVRDGQETPVAVMQQTLFTMPGLEPAARYLKHS